MAIEVIKTKSGFSYRVVIRVKGKKVPSKCFHRKVDAKAWEREKLCARDRGELLHKPEPKVLVSFATVYSRFREEYAQIRQSPSTQKIEEQMYRKHVARYLERQCVQLLDGMVLEELFRDLLRKGITAKRVNRIRTMLHCILNFAVRAKLIDHNPVSSTRPLPVPGTTFGQTSDFLSQEETERLLNWLKENDSWLYPKVTTLVNTGMRYGEMMGLRVQDLRLNSSGAVLVISRNYDRHTFVVRERTKGNRSRIFPISEEMKMLLLKQAEGKCADDPLLRENWTECRHSTKFRNHFKRALKASGVKRVRIHDLRHTFSVHFIERRGPQFNLQQLLGHSTSKLTERYLHFSEDMQVRSRGLVDHHGRKHSKGPLTVDDGKLRSTLSHQSPIEMDFPIIEIGGSVDPKLVN